LLPAPIKPIILGSALLINPSMMAGENSHDSPYKIGRTAFNAGILFFMEKLIER